MNTSRRRGPTGSVSLTLPPQLASVRKARSFVLESCIDASLPERSVDDALLLTSELVTNAVLHGRSEVCVEVTVEATLVRISVFDENSRHPARVVEDPDALDGRGLALVAALAERWGTEDKPMGKAVWFELVRP